MISTDIPEFAVLATAAGIDPEKMGAAFNDPLHFFQYLSLEDLNRLRESIARFTLLGGQLHGALETYATFAKGFLAGRGAED